MTNSKHSVHVSGVSVIGCPSSLITILLMPNRTWCSTARSVHSLYLLPLLHNDVGPSSQVAAEW